MEPGALSTRRAHSSGSSQAGAVLALRLTSRAKHNSVVGRMEDGRIKITLTAPPVEGKANAALLRYLSEVLGVSESDLELVAGHTGRDKLVRVRGLEQSVAEARLLAQVGG